MSKDTFDTLGNQKQKNYALVMTNKQEFVKELTTGILPPPQYFSKNAQLNKSGKITAHLFQPQIPASLSYSLAKN